MFLSSSPSRFLNSRILYMADDGAGASGGSDGDQQSAKPKQSEIDNAVSARIAELLGAKSVNNDPLAALTISIKAQHRLEQENERLKGQVGQLPADVKTKLESYEALGSVDDVTKQINDGKTATERATALEREKAISSAAEVLGLKPNALLKGLLRDVNLKVDGEGEARKVVIVDADNKELAFDDYAKTRADLMDAMPALQVGEAAPVRREAPRTESQHSGKNDAIMGADEMEQVARAMGLPMPKATA